MGLPGWPLLGLAILCPLLVTYLYALSNRLWGVAQTPSFTEDELAKVSYESVDTIKFIPAKVPNSGYAIVGGSGFLGTYIIQLLLLRGETNIRILDLHPPSSKIASHLSVSFVKTDITSLQSVRAGLGQPFESTGAPPNVIFHTAAIIRFWERFSYCWKPSYDVNVSGTENVVLAAKDIPSAILIYTSTSDTVIPCPKFLRIGWDLKHDVNLISDSDEPLSSARLSESCYSRSKRLAEQLVANADGEHGLRTGIIRPGCTITGPNDRLLTSTLVMPRVPVCDKYWRTTNICAWDAAAAHLNLENALRQNNPDARGQAFLVTGKGPAWSLEDNRQAVKYYSSREIVLDDVPPLVMYILAHLVEAFLFARYHLLLPFFLFFTDRRPQLTPKWMGQLVYLQPATLEYLNNVVIDDSRAKKVLGYRPQWGTAQYIRYTVDEFQSGRSGSSHGLELK